MCLRIKLVQIDRFRPLVGASELWTKVQSKFTEFLKGLLGQIATGAIKSLVDRGVGNWGTSCLG